MPGGNGRGSGHRCALLASGPPSVWEGGRGGLGGTGQASIVQSFPESGVWSRNFVGEPAAVPGGVSTPSRSSTPTGGAGHPEASWATW